MLLLEPAAGSEHVGSDVVDSGLQNCSGGLGHPVDVLIGDPSGAEDASIREPLGSQISNGQLRQHDLRTDIVDLLQLLVDDLPLRVYDALEVLDIADPDLRVLLLRLQLQLDLEDDDLGVREFLGLLLETRVGEGLLEGHAAHQEGIVD